MALDPTLRTSLILRSVSGGLSVAGSLLILYLIAKDRHTKKKDTRNFYRIMGALSFFDIFYSSCYPLNWWSALTDPNNKQICNFIGFVFVVSQASTYYNASLSIYYVLVINFNKSQDWILKRAMPPLLAVPLFYGLLSASIAMGLDAYGWNGFGCWFMGEHMEVLSNFVAGWTPVILALFIVVVCMAAIVRSVFLIEKKILSYGHPRHSGHSNSQGSGGGGGGPTSSSIVSEIQKMNKTKQLAYEAMLFIGAFLSSYVWFPMIAAQLNAMGGVSLAVTMGYSFCAPLQGFWNFLIFHRRYRKMTSSQRAGSSARGGKAGGGSAANAAWRGNNGGDNSGAAARRPFENNTTKTSAASSVPDVGKANDKARRRSTDGLSYGSEDDEILESGEAGNAEVEEGNDAEGTFNDEPAELEAPDNKV